MLQQFNLYTSTNEIISATGSDFADALATAALAAQKGHPLLLVGNLLDSTTSEYLHAEHSDVERLSIVGGTLENTVINEMLRALQ